MATLKSKHKRFVVTQLACYEPPSRVIEDLHDKFGVEATASQIAYYDPTNSQGSGLAKKWKELFNKTREKFQEGTIDIAIVHRQYRLKVLDEMAKKLRKMRNYKGAAELLEQAAKEVGGAFTNRKELTGKNGGPIKSEDRVHFYMPDNGRD